MALYTTTSRPTQWTKASARALSFDLLSSFILFSASFSSTNGRTVEGVRRRSCQHESAVNTRADARKGGGLLAYHHAVGVRGEHGRRRVTRLDFPLEVPPEQGDAHCMLVAALRLGVDARRVCVVAAIYPTPGLGALMLRSCDKNTWLHCEHVCASDYACQHGALGRGSAPTKRSPAAAHAKSCWILFMPSENQPNTSQAWEHRGSG